MPTPPVIPELQFLQTTLNQREFRNKLLKLGLTSAEDAIKEQAHYVGLRWLKLADMHLREARRSFRAKSRRSAYSRAYYAVYNASKTVRYIATGTVSLRADDHQKASELPGDFPNPVDWGLKITKLYEQRLRADYDNWGKQRTQFRMKDSDCVETAADFLRACKAYLRDKHGLAI